MIFFLFAIILAIKSSYDEFEVSDNMWWWVWVAGDSDVNSKISTVSGSTDPGGRSHFGYWYFDNDFYVFGGARKDGLYNDLWKIPISVYGMSSSSWSLLSGSVTPNSLPSSSQPGGRRGTSSWTYSNKLYLFGGFGYASNSKAGYLNDLWVRSSGTWGLLSGTYGSVNNVPSGNQPGGLSEAFSGAVYSGKLYMFGGLGYCTGSDLEFCSTLYVYNTGGSWAKATTSATEPTSSNPGPRASGMLLHDSTKMYLLGGTGEKSFGSHYTRLFSASDTSGDEWTRVTNSNADSGTNYEHAWGNDHYATSRYSTGGGLIHSTAADVDDSRLVMYSGASEHGLVNDLWIARYRSTTPWSWYWVDGKSGGVHSTYTNGVYWNDAQNSWNMYSFPPQRSGYGSFVVTNSEGDYFLFIFGGFSDEQNGFKNDMWFAVDLSMLTNYNCYDYSRFSSNVCSAHGRCVGNDDCACEEEYDDRKSCIKKVDIQEGESVGFYVAIGFAVPISLLTLVYVVIVFIFITAVLAFRIFRCIYKKKKIKEMVTEAEGIDFDNYDGKGDEDQIEDEKELEEDEDDETPQQNEGDVEKSDEEEGEKKKRRRRRRRRRKKEGEGEGKGEGEKGNDEEETENNDEENGERRRRRRRRRRKDENEEAKETEKKEDDDGEDNGERRRRRRRRRRRTEESQEQNEEEEETGEKRRRRRRRRRRRTEDRELEEM